MRPGASASRGTFGVRVLIRLLTLALGVLIFWLLGFLVDDIESIQGPDRVQIEQRYVDQALVDQRVETGKQIEQLDREIKSESEQQRLVGDSSANLQRTINQLLDLQKTRLEKDVAPSETEREDLSASLARFLESQKTYQELNRDIAARVAQKAALEADDRDLEQRIAKQREPAEKEYERAVEAHRLRLALYELAILVPLLGLAAAVLLRRAASLYAPLFVAAAGAILLKIGLVLHEYFPTRYFKYVLILSLLALVTRLLVQAIRSVAHPRLEALRRQYREAYERFLCPVCEYPIRTGPRRFLYWTRRTVHRSLPQAHEVAGAEAEERYVCPDCGTALFAPCSACQRVRHELLPYCEHCGAEAPPRPGAPGRRTA